MSSKKEVSQNQQNAIAAAVKVKEWNEIAAKLCAHDHGCRVTKSLFARMEEARKTSKKAPTNNSPTPTTEADMMCLCGCGERPARKRLFKQGHDMKLRSAVLRHVRGKEESTFTEEQKAYVASTHWSSEEILNAL